jgi:hypothetical protein
MADVLIENTDTIEEFLQKSIHELAILAES